MSYKILFVCLGNICRSPAAENIMNYLISQAGLNDRLSCDSAGTSSYHIGAPPDARMSSAAQKRGIKLVGKARRFEVSDFTEFDLIIAMDRDNYRDLLSLDPEGKYHDKVKLMSDFAVNTQFKDVRDPYYGGQRGFDQVIDLLLDSCQGLLDTLPR
ncbi:MAG: low molecular weight phosphotyrosine protein phosphatase [Gloeocapsa sp. DLM2.Bin57]|jgi:protein-tyrosine phosphatase|nr:MAG: low molecular weight phosphotyrosine protein phosphatase [Gloeocapsa sp. DLM2.Bin57]